MDKQHNRIQQLLPGKTIWIAIAAISCAVFMLIHTLFGSIGTDALTAKTGIAQTTDVASAIVSKIPLNFDNPERFQAKVIRAVNLPSKEKVIALTFDDGPWPVNTEHILATLKRENIKATFFMIGQPLKSYPEIAKKVLADGHVVGNHTLHHWYNKMSPLVAQREIDDTAKIIKEVLNVETDYFRPPGGVLNNGLVAYSKSKKQSVMMWSVDSEDSQPHRPSPAAMIKTVMAGAKPGGIVLMHDGGGSHGNTAIALPTIIAKLRANGYKFVTIPELLAMDSLPADNPTAGTTPIPSTTPAKVTANQT